MVLELFRRLLSRTPGPRDVSRARLTMIPLQRLYALVDSADTALKNERGDVLEFGVALGGSSVLLARLAKQHQCRFAGFDVFGLHPAPSANDDEASLVRYEEIASGKAKGIGGDVYYGYQPDLFGRVCETLERYGAAVDGQEIQLIKGLFEETWPRFPRRPVAFAHVDVSWHDPVRYSLEAVAPHLTPRGRVVVNTYHDAEGSRKAVDGFLGSHPEFVMEMGETPVLRRA